MKRQNDLLDDHGSVAVLPLGEHAIGASLPDSLAIAATLLHARNDGVFGQAHLEVLGGNPSRYRGSAPSALYARMLRRYLCPNSDGTDA
ncbi:MAG: hypothetical protein AAF577_03210 [Pseudomonadota bacterium]